MGEQDTNADWSGFNAFDPSTQSIRHRYFTAALGGLVSRAIPMSDMQKVLDVGCGAGGWAISMAKHYPWTRVTGIDVDELALRDARLQGHWSGSRGFSFMNMDASKTLGFEDGDFDLVHMRCATFLRSGFWGDVLDELVRVLRPGGWLNLVEYESGRTSSPSLNTLLDLHAQAMQSYRPGVALVTPRIIRPATDLYGFLLAAGLLDASYTVHVVDFGAGNPLGSRSYIEDLLTTAVQMKSFICRLDLIRPSNYEALMRKARKEMASPYSSGYGYLISATGCKNG